MQKYYRILDPKRGAERADQYGATFEETASAAAFCEDKEFVPDEHDAPTASKSIEEDYGDTIRHKIIVRDEGDENSRRDNCFWVHDAPASLYALIRAQKQAPAYHEVALPGLPRKLFFDFDFSAEHFADLVRGHEPRVKAIMAQLTSAPEALARTPSPPAFDYGDGITRTHSRGCFRDGEPTTPATEIIPLPPAVVSDLLAAHDPDKQKLGGYELFSDPDDKLRRIVGHILLRHFMRFLTLAFGRNCYLLHCQSSTTASAKFSAHLIVGAYADTYHDVAEVAILLFQRFGAQDEVAYLASRFLDMGVYKSIQNLRIALCKKPNTRADRIKVLVASPWDDAYEGWRHTLVTQVDGSCDLKLAPRFDNIKNETYGVTVRGQGKQAELPADFIARLGVHAQGFRVNRVIDNLVTFQRMGVSAPCVFCNRVHDSDNTLMVTIVYASTKGAPPTLIVRCRRDAAHRKLVL